MCAFAVIVGGALTVRVFTVITASGAAAVFRAGTGDGIALLMAPDAMGTPVIRRAVLIATFLVGCAGA